MCSETHRKQRKRTDEPELWKTFQRRGTIQILLALDGSDGVRASELDRSHPYIARQVLGARLKELLSLGVVERSVIVGPPLGSLYSLTATGRQLAGAAVILRDVSANMPDAANDQNRLPVNDLTVDRPPPQSESATAR